MSGKSVLAELLSLFFLILVLYFPAPCCAQAESPSDPSSVQNLISDGLSKGKTICTVVGELIKEGTESSDTVNNAIVMGHPACVVVRCAIEAGGKLEDVIIAAYRAGATSDIIVTCLIESGVPSDVLAATIERLGLPGLGYAPPPATPGYAPAFSPAVGGGGGGTGTVSPIRP